MSFINKLLHTPPPEYSEENRQNLDPMEKAKRAYDRRVGSVLVQNYNLRRLCLLLGIAIIVLSGGLIVQSLKSTVEPYVIEVDSQTGLVRNVGLVSHEEYKPQEAEMKYFLGQFIRNIRELPLDIVIYKQNINTAYSFLTKDAANKMNSILGSDESLVKDIGKKTVIVKINTVLPIAGAKDSYQIRWTEETYMLGSDKKTISNMSATVTVAIKAPKDVATVNINPLGIYIKDFNWDKEAETKK